MQPPPPDQSIAAYYRALSESYEVQLKLLKTVKFWYLLPLWIGLLALALARYRIDRDLPATLFSLGIPTVFCGLVWWLNEVPGVRYLRRRQAELAGLIEHPNDTR
jgi:hypothetical protein